MGSVRVFQEADEGEAVPLSGLALMYHRILPDPGEDSLGTHVSLGRFTEHLEILKAHHDVREVRELAPFLEEGRLPEGSVWITFDDGYRDGLMHAAPALGSQGMPAAFFVPTRFVGSETPLADERLRRAVENSGRSALTLPDGTVLPLKTAEQRHLTIHGVLKYMHSLSSGKKEDLVTGLSRQLGVDEGVVQEEHLPMTWSQLGALLRQGMTLGSHGRTHRSLAAMSRIEVNDELEGSRRDLREHLGLETRFLSYPYGRPRDVSRAVAETAADIGFELAFTASPGPVPGSEDPLFIRRIEVKDWDGPEFARQLDSALRMDGPMERFDA